MPKAKKKAKKPVKKTKKVMIECLDCGEEFPKKEINEDGLCELCAELAEADKDDDLDIDMYEEEEEEVIEENE